jgi:hypothetical protein
VRVLEDAKEDEERVRGKVRVCTGMVMESIVSIVLLSHTEKHFILLDMGKGKAFVVADAKERATVSEKGKELNGGNQVV